MFFWNSLFYDPTDVGNLVSGSSALSKSRLNIWKFLVRILLKPRLKNFEHYFASMWNECNCVSLNILWHYPSLGLKWKLTFSSPVATAGQICWHIECSTFRASSFSIWNRSSGIPSPPLALFLVMLCKATWLHTTRCLALGWWPHRDWTKTTC